MKLRSQNNPLLSYPPKWNWCFFILSGISGLVFEIGGGCLTEDRIFYKVVSSALCLILFGYWFYGTYYLIRRHRFLRKIESKLYPEYRCDIFISHSNKDCNLAEALVRLFDALYPQSVIRCTSVSGYGYNSGEHFTEEMRSECATAKIFIALITPQSVQSIYTLFEFGARWGSGLPTNPVLAHGVDCSVLPGPLKEVHAHSISRHAGVLSLIEDVGMAIQMKPRNISKYESLINHLNSVATDRNSA